MYQEQYEITLRNKTVGRMTVQVQVLNMSLDTKVLRLYTRQFLKTQRLSKRRMSEELLSRRLGRALHVKFRELGLPTSDIEVAVFYGNPPESIQAL